MYLKEDVVKTKIISDEASAYCINLNVKENLKKNIYLYLLSVSYYLLMISITVNNNALTNRGKNSTGNTVMYKRALLYMVVDGNA